MNNAFKLKKISLNKCLLFLSAYSPLFLIISIKTVYYTFPMELPFINRTYAIPVISIILIIIFCIMVYLSNYLINTSKKTTNKYFKVSNVDERTDMILSYFVPYIISFISLKTTEEIISALIIFLFIFLIYYSSELLYINPIFMLFGYKFYHLYTEKNHVLILSKQDLYRNIGETITVKQLSTRLYILNGD